MNKYATWSKINKGSELKSLRHSGATNEDEDFTKDKRFVHVIFVENVRFGKHQY